MRHWKLDVRAPVAWPALHHVKRQLLGSRLHIITVYNLALALYFEFEIELRSDDLLLSVHLTQRRENVDFALDHVQGGPV
jgi:hypothetical protein